MHFVNMKLVPLTLKRLFLGGNGIFVCSWRLMCTMPLTPMTEETMALRISTSDGLGLTSERRPNTGATKASALPPAVAYSSHSHSRPASSDASAMSSVRSRPGSSSSTTAPSEAIYNTQFTTAGRKFLSKVKKNRAMQVDRRTKGFQLGLDNKTMILDPLTKKHFRVMIVDPDLQHREDLADALEQYFEILVAATNERAFALLAMFPVDFVLLRLTLGNDHSIATSTGLQFIREIKRRYYHIPVSLLIRDSTEQAKLLSQALTLGGCGFFEDSITIETLIDRMKKLLHSLVLATGEMVKCRGKTMYTKDEEEELARGVGAAQAMLKRGTTAHLASRPATSKPATLVYDKDKMLLELGLKQRKQCLVRRKQLAQTLATSHSVLGIGLREEPDSSMENAPLSPLRTPSLMHCESTSTLLSCATPVSTLTALRANSIMKKIPPLPSQQEISKRMYAKPHEIQTKIHRHLYESYHTTKHDAVPHDPLLRPCVAVDPESVSRSASNLLVGKAYRLYLEKRYEEAHQQCDRAIRLQDNNVVKLAYLLRGVLYDLSGHHARAEREFLTALKLDPQLHQAHFNLCVCRLKMGKDHEALQDVTTALHMDASNEDYLRNRALIYRRLGEFGLAQNEYSKIESLGRPKSPLTALPPSPTSHHQPGSPSTNRSRVDAVDVDEGLFDHLFGKPTPDKLALVTLPSDRDSDMLDLVVSRLQGVLFFQDFPRDVLVHVAQHLEYEVVVCGKSFKVGEDHPHNFYVLLSGRLSVRRKLGDFASAVTTHHMDAGLPFGCTGHIIGSHTHLIADESSEVGILWPDAYEATIHNFCTDKNNEVFLFLQQLKAFQKFSTSELGHIIGISERRRFRKGDVLLHQNDVPKYLVILRKGTCSMYQEFDKPPLCDNDGVGSASEKATKKDRVLPYHRLLATQDWPLGFHVEPSLKKKRKHIRGRRNALLDRKSAPSPADLMLQAAHFGLATDSTDVDGNDTITRGSLVNCDEPMRTLGPGAIFGESSFLEQQHTQAKCSIVADSVVEVLLFDHLRLQEMELSRDVVDDIVANGPEYVDEEKAAKQQLATEAWHEYRSLRMLEVSKTRWPEAKKHMRVLANGCSIMLGEAVKARARTSSSSTASNHIGNQ